MSAPCIKPRAVSYRKKEPMCSVAALSAKKIPYKIGTPHLKKSKNSDHGRNERMQSMASRLAGDELLFVTVWNKTLIGPSLTWNIQAFETDRQKKSRTSFRCIGSYIHKILGSASRPRHSEPFDASVFGIGRRLNRFIAAPIPSDKTARTTSTPCMSISSNDSCSST